jgi:hypothetical protein
LDRRGVERIEELLAHAFRGWIAGAAMLFARQQVIPRDAVASPNDKGV